MKFQIGILTLFVACHLVKSDLLLRLTTMAAVFDEVPDGIIKVSNKVVDKVTIKTTTEAKNKEGCILNCNLKKKKEYCTKKMLELKCITCNNECRCPGLGSNKVECGLTLLQISFILTGIIIVIIVFIYLIQN